VDVNSSEVKWKSAGSHRLAGSPGKSRVSPRLAIGSNQTYPVSSMSEAPLIHIIDDDESMRLSLAGLLRSVGLASRAYSTVDSFLALPPADLPGCLILDIRLPGINGLDFQAQLLQLGIQLPVVLMSGYGDVPMSVRGMKAGAVDFLMKPFRDQDMLDAIAIAVSRDRLRRAADADGASLKARFATLSRREQQVMELVSAGNMNKQVAALLLVSEITVKIHRGSAMRKMGARTLADLVRMSEALGLPR
jgi:FixJ family two-component response regulator